MTRVMDGVVRRNWVQPAPVRAPEPRPVRTAPPAPSINVVTGLDGIRRTQPSLLQTAQNISVVEPRTRAWLPGRRSAIAFGLLSIAIVASGFTAIMLNKNDGPTASAESVARAKASQVAAQVAATPSATPTPKPTGQLQSIVNSFVAGKEDKFGIVVKDLKSGETATLNAERSETSASLYKLFVAQQIFAKIDSGELSYAQSAGGGTGRTIDGCLTIMINISDNGCGSALGEILHWGAQNPSLKAAGYTGTNLATLQQTDPQDVATLMERIYNGQLNSPASNEHYLSLLKDQRVNNRLPLGLPSGTVIAHKTGDLYGYIHDAGIVYGPKTDYLVVVMGSPGTTYGQFIDLSTKLWNYFEN